MVADQASSLLTLTWTGYLSNAACLQHSVLEPNAAQVILCQSIANSIPSLDSAEPGAPGIPEQSICSLRSKHADSAACLTDVCWASTAGMTQMHGRIMPTQQCCCRMM